MDNISEQLIKINKTGKDHAKLALIWCGAFVVVFLLVWLALNYSSFIGFFFLFIAGTMFGAYKLSSMLEIEYEYIVVNHDMDIDKIVAKSNRKRLVSVKLNEVQEFGIYDKERAKKLANRNFDDRFFCCNDYDEAYYLTVKHPKKGMILVVAAMNDRTRTEALKSIPRTAVM